MTATAVARWAVQCPAYTLPATSREVAERQLAQVVDAGHCMFAHEVVEVRRCDSCDAEGWPRYSPEHGAYFCDGCYGREVEAP